VCQGFKRRRLAGLSPAALAAHLDFGQYTAIGGVVRESVDADRSGVRVVQGRLTCLVFSGDITNPDPNSINTADVFGRVYDKAGNGITDNLENDRIAFVDGIPPGKSRVRACVVGRRLKNCCPCVVHVVNRVTSNWWYQRRCDAVVRVRAQCVGLRQKLIRTLQALEVHVTQLRHLYCAL
jgi:hypothetical protein